MRDSILIFGDQLSLDGAGLHGADPARDVVVMVEARRKADERPYHKRKLVLLYSAMRHFAASLRARGWTVDYYALDAPDAPDTFADALQRHLERHAPLRLVLMEPNEWGLRESAHGWDAIFGLPVDMREDTLFMASHEDFDSYARRRRAVRLEAFYHAMRVRYDVLMENGKPVGGRFNFDADNRARYTPDAARPLPPPPAYTPDALTREVIALVEERFAHHFGDLDGFALPVTHEQALHLFERFMDTALPHFGAFEDAMVQGEWLLYHSLLSHVLNLGLLRAEDVVRAAAARYDAGAVPLNSAEGFIRQILGWREYMRGIYWNQMPGLHDANYFGHARHLPRFYWTGETDMNCMAQAVATLRSHGYTHHIQRLMVLANWANLAGVTPSEVNDWFWQVYIDAYDWVVTPNVVGMALYADGGETASKPYIGGGNYINSMSDYCGHCRYNVRMRTGEDACPFNYLYWSFLDRNKDKLRGNSRMRLPIQTVERKSATELQAIRESSSAFLEKIDSEDGGASSSRP